MRLRLALFVKDLAQRFNIPTTTTHRVIQKGLDVTYARLQFLISWPCRDIMEQNKPAVVYPTCRCIIDCSEVFVECTTNLG